MADLLAHVRAGLGLGLLPNLPDQPGAPLVDFPALGPADVRIERAERAIDITLPQNAARDEAIDTLSEAVATSLLKAERLESLVADAGIFVEPETGRVRIEATGLSGEAQLLVDGLNAQITQRVTFAELDEAIINANFDPSQIADLGNVFFRLSTAESTLDAQAGTITDLTETLTVEGGVVSMATVTQRLDSVEGEIVNKVDVTTVDDLQTQVNTVEQTLSGVDGARFETLLTSSAALSAEADDLAELTLAQFLDAHRGDKAAREGVALARQDMWARADATDEAVAGLRVDLGVTFGDARALIQQEATVRAGADEVFAETVDQIAVDLQAQSSALTGVASALDDTSARVTDTEAGLDIVSRTSRANTAGIGINAEDAASVDLRAILDDHEARKAVRAGVAQVRSDTQAIVEEDRLALARARDELTAAIGQADARVTQTQTALATETQARAEQVLELDGRIGDAEGGLTQLNLVDVTSESALVQSHLQLTGRVEDAEGGLLDVLSLEIDPQSVLASQVRLLQGSIGSVNLVRNGDLGTGDLTGWQNVSPLMSVVTRGPSGAGVIDNAPTPFMLRVDGGAFASAQLSGDIPFRPGEELEVSFAAALLTGGSADFNLRFEWLDGGGAVIGTNVQTLTVSGNFWRRSDFDPIAPLPDTEMVRIFLRRNATTEIGVIADINVSRIGADQVRTKGQVSTIESTKVDAAGAVAAVEQQISASYGDLTAMATATSFAEATADGIAAGFVWRLNGQSLLEAVSVSDGTTGPVSTFRLAADYVQITGLTQIDDAVNTELAADTAFIENLTVTNANLSGPIQSDNFVDGEAGWRITRAGGAQFNGPVISRNIVAAEGSFQPGVLTQNINTAQAEMAEIATWDLIDTGVVIPADQLWAPIDKVFIPVAAFSGEAFTTLTFTPPSERIWGCTAELRPFTNWSGSQTLKIKITFWGRNVEMWHANADTNASGTIAWKLY